MTQTLTTAEARVIAAQARLWPTESVRAAVSRLPAAPLSDGMLRMIARLELMRRARAARAGA